MPNTTHGLPYPSPTDPVAGGAAAIQALAEAVDTKGLGQIVHGGRYSVTTDAFGDFTIPKPATILGVLASMSTPPMTRTAHSRASATRVSTSDGNSRTRPPAPTSPVGPSSSTCSLSAPHA